jgi:hypothetical protein
MEILRSPIVIPPNIACIMQGPWATLPHPQGLASPSLE